MHFNFFHVFSWLSGSFLFNEPNTVSLSECTTFAHSSVEEHLGCFQVVAVINRAAANIPMQVLCGYNGFSLFLSCLFIFKIGSSI